MAKELKNKNNSDKTKDFTATFSPYKKTNQAYKIRLTLGILFLLFGIALLVSISSYFFTWQVDQDLLLSQQSYTQFLLHNHESIANWGGRIGALMAHILVYRGVGIAAIGIALWFFSVGLLFIYRKKYALAIRYMRWLCLLLLIIAPILSYLLPNSSFPWGGAWGNESIRYLNGLVGWAGTGLLILTVAALLLFVVFAIDISPLIQQAKKAKARLHALIENEKNQPDFIKENSQENIANQDFHSNQNQEEEREEDNPTPTSGNRLKEPQQVPFEIENENHLLAIDPLMPLESVITKTTHAPKENTPTDFSFEVAKKEEDIAPKTIAHGAHISIEDGEPYDPELDLPGYKFPTLDLMEDRGAETISLDKEELEKNKNQIEYTLKSFGIEIKKISATVGPTVTLYEIIPAEGVRISKIKNLEDDIALNLAALGIRIIAPIPGKGTIGIEVPNANKQIVSMRTLLSSEKFINNKMSLPIALGKKIDGENYIVDLATMPHLLMAGATGQGKSVGINAILVSLLYKKHPSQLKFVLVDPKKVELSIYQRIEKHFLAKLPNEDDPIITDTKKVIYTLNALCIEMDNRYELLKEAGARNIKEYNEKFISRRLNPEKGHKFLPFIVLVVDEFADLIMTAGKEVEIPIARLAQLARAIGIHLIIATQRPSVNVITGTIKANFPGRVAFKVSAKVDSRTILDTGGADQLIGRGDMLVSAGSELLRVQCAFVDTPEVEQVVKFIGDQKGYGSAFDLPEYEGDESDSNGKSIDLTNRDKLFEDCARLVVQTQTGSTSNLQRKLNLGYNRAGRIMDQLEAAGIVGPAVGSKPRDVYFKTEMELQEFLMKFD